MKNVKTKGDQKREHSTEQLDIKVTAENSNPEDYSKQVELILKVFKIGDWVKGVGKHEGVSQVFMGYGFLQPFTYLDCFEPEQFKLATSSEIGIAKNKQ